MKRSTGTTDVHDVAAFGDSNDQVTMAITDEAPPKDVVITTAGETTEDVPTSRTDPPMSHLSTARGTTVPDQSHAPTAHETCSYMCHCFSIVTI